VQFILTFRELGDHIDKNIQAPTNADSLSAWRKEDGKARAIIGLSLSDEHLEHVRDCDTAMAMWMAIEDLFQRRTLLNRLAARRRFYSVKMMESEKAIAYISRVRQLAADLKSMDAIVTDQEIAMTVLCGLPAKFEHLIVAIDAVANDEKLTMDFVKSRLLQEEQRIIDRTPFPTKPSGDSALVNRAFDRTRPKCTHCKRPGHDESKCWDKYPHLRPNRRGLLAAANVNSPAEVQDHESSGDEFICLVATSSTALNVTESAPSKNSWVIDTGATAHMSFDKSLISEFQECSAFQVGMGDESSVTAFGYGSVLLTLCVSGRKLLCKLKNVLYVPKLSYNLMSISAIDEQGFKTEFIDGACRVSKGTIVAAEGTLKKGLYILNTACTARYQGKHQPRSTYVFWMHIWKEYTRSNSQARGGSQLYNPGPRSYRCLWTISCRIVRRFKILRVVH